MIGHGVAAPSHGDRRIVKPQSYLVRIANHRPPGGATPEQKLC